MPNSSIGPPGSAPCIAPATGRAAANPIRAAVRFKKSRLLGGTDNFGRCTFSPLRGAGRSVRHPFTTARPPKCQQEFVWPREARAAAGRRASQDGSSKGSWSSHQAGVAGLFYLRPAHRGARSTPGRVRTCRFRWGSSGGRRTSSRTFRAGWGSRNSGRARRRAYPRR